MNFIRRCMLALVLATTAACSSIQAPQPKAVQEVSAIQTSVSPTQVTQRDVILSNAISAKYKCKPEVAKQVVKSSSQHSYKDFPTQQDILAIIALESRFNPFARQGGSFGLMQVLVKTHKALIQDKNSIDDQNKVGSTILRNYYVDMGHSKKAAVMSYNSGPGAYHKGVRATQYYQLYQTNLDWVKTQYKVQTF